MVFMYGVYYGFMGLKNIVLRIYQLMVLLAIGLKWLNYSFNNDYFFDILWVGVGEQSVLVILKVVEGWGINLWFLVFGEVGISLDEMVMVQDLFDLW